MPRKRPTLHALSNTEFFLSYTISGKFYPPTKCENRHAHAKSTKTRNTDSYIIMKVLFIFSEVFQSVTELKLLSSKHRTHTKSMKNSPRREEMSQQKLCTARTYNLHRVRYTFHGGVQYSSTVKVRYYSYERYDMERLRVLPL